MLSRSISRSTLAPRNLHQLRSRSLPPLLATSSARHLSTTAPRSYPPRNGPPPPPPQGGGGGFPIGNIFNQGQQKREPGSTLKENGVDLTELASKGKLDPVIGRDAETKRCIEILSRRSKNNPLLIGPAGVGKTAIMEGLAQKIIAGEVPESLKGRRVVSIDLSTLMSGVSLNPSFSEHATTLPCHLIYR